MPMGILLFVKNGFWLKEKFGGKEKMSTFAIPNEKRVADRPEFLKRLTRKTEKFLKKNLEVKK